MQALKRKRQRSTKKEYTKKLFLLSSIEEIRLFNKMNVYVTGKAASSVMGFGHDSNISGHVQFAENMSEVNDIYWWNKAPRVESYTNGVFNVGNTITQMKEVLWVWKQWE